MAKAPLAPEFAVVSTETGGRLLGLTAERVRQLAKEGAIAKQGRDRFRIFDLVQGYLSFLRDEDRQSNKSAADAKLQAKRVELADLRILRESKALQAAAQAEGLAVIDEFAGGLKSDLMAMAARVTDSLELRRKIEENIDVAFGAAAKRAAATATLVEASLGALGSEGEDEPGRMGEAE